jgi:outer membrane murein-binding lipoprotein Lpp
MKKLLFLFLMTAMVATTYAQTQLSTIRGKTKDGKRVKIEYYKGNVEDVIQSISYEAVDELQARVKQLRSELDEANKEVNRLNSASDNDELKRLRKKVSDFEKESKSMRKQISDLNKDIKDLNSEIDQLRTGANVDTAEIAHYKATLAEKERALNEMDGVVAACNVKIDQLSQEVKILKGIARPPASPVIGIEAGMGPAFIGKNASEPWAKDVNWAKMVDIYFGTANLTESFPLSVEAGVGIRNFGLSASLAESSLTVKANDADGDPAEAVYTFRNLAERLSLTYLDIPVRLCFGQPLKDRVVVYAKLGLTPSLKVASSFTGEGRYDLEGYYQQWDVTLDDIDELGYGEDLPCYEGYEPALKSFVLWGNVALGAYVPFKNSPIALNAGLKLDIPLTVLGEAAASETFIPGTHAAVLSQGGKAVIPSVELGLVYNLK